MDDLFSASTRERSFKNAPLAVRMRPNSLDEYVGQQKAVGKGSWLRAAIEHDVLSSVILYGPARLARARRRWPTLSPTIPRASLSRSAP